MKVGQLYNVDSFKDMGGMVGETIRNIKFGDAYNGTVLERNLTAVDPTVFEKKYPDLTFFNTGISADNSGGYAKRIQSLRLLDHGEFKTAGDNILVHQKEAFAEWTDTDVKTAALENYSLTGRLMSAIDKQYKREIDAAGLIGIESNKGLLNNTIFGTSSAGGAIATLTAQEMYDEICALILDQHSAVSNTQEYMADMVITPVDVLNTLQKTMLNTAAGSNTVLTALKANFPGVAFMSSFRAATGGIGAVSATCAIKASGDTMKFRLPTPLEIGQIFPLGSFHWKVDAQYRCAGLDILESTSGRLLTGL